MPGGKRVEDGFEYNSGNNTQWLGVDELKEALKHMQYCRPLIAHRQENGLFDAVILSVNKKGYPIMICS